MFDYDEAVEQFNICKEELDRRQKAGKLLSVAYWVSLAGLIIIFSVLAALWVHAYQAVIPFVVIYVAIVMILVLTLALARSCQFNDSVIEHLRCEKAFNARIIDFHESADNDD